MKLTAQIRYQADPEAVMAMLLDREFQARKCVANGAFEHAVEVSEHRDGSATISTRRTLPTDSVPDFIRTFVGAALRVSQVEEWAPPQPDGSRTGRTTVQIEGAPVRLIASLSLSRNGAGTVESIDGNLKASVPLIGGRVEQAAEPAIRSAIRVEERTGTAWLAERG